MLKKYKCKTCNQVYTYEEIHGQDTVPCKHRGAGNILCQGRISAKEVQTELPLWEEVKDMRFEDRIASAVLAHLYSYHHIEVTCRHICGGTKKELIQKKILTRDEALSMPTSVKQSDVLNLRREAWLNAIPEQSKSFYDHLNNCAFQHLLFRGIKQEEIAKKEDVSDIEYDTVAALVHENDIYLACNFKVRVMKNGEVNSFDYPGFGWFSYIAILNIVGAVSEELRDPEGSAVSRSRKLYFLSPVGVIVNEMQNAAPHAEMQLLRYAQEKNWGNGLYIGVSKPCCTQCAAKLKENRVNYRAESTIVPKHFSPLNTIRVRIEHCKEL